MPAKKTTEGRLAPPYEDAEVVAMVGRLAAIVSRDFSFGYYDVDDLRQECAIFALEALPRYVSGGLDAGGLVRRPLDKFLYSHFRKRLINLKRDKFRRADPPCLSCHIEDYTVHEHDGACPEYAAWRSRNDSKAGLMSPIGLTMEEPPGKYADSEAEATAERNELIEKLDALIPARLRSSYAKLKAGLPVSRQHRKAIRALIAEAFGPGDEFDG